MSEANQTDKEKYITAMWDLKCDTNALIHETETDSQNRLAVAMGEGWIGIWGLSYANYYTEDG